MKPKGDPRGHNRIRDGSGRCDKECPVCERDALFSLLIRCRSELRSVLADINAEQIPHDGDDFHELLRELDAALAPKP